MSPNFAALAKAEINRHSLIPESTTNIESGVQQEINIHPIYERFEKSGPLRHRNGVFIYIYCLLLHNVVMSKERQEVHPPIKT
jgi:hypothetical protein